MASQITSELEGVVALIRDFRTKPLMPLNPRDGAILAKGAAFCAAHELASLNEKIFPRSFFGIESNFVANYPKLVRPNSRVVSADWGKEAKLLANDKAGKAGRSTWYVIRRSAIKENKAEIGFRLRAT